jgi:hypothetical protein
LENKNSITNKAKSKHKSSNSSSSGSGGSGEEDDNANVNLNNKTKKKQLSRAISLYHQPDLDSPKVSKIISHVETFKHLDNSTSTLTNSMDTNVNNKNNSKTFINIKEKNIYDYPLKKGNVKRSLSLKCVQERPDLGVKIQLKSKCEPKSSEDKNSDNNTESIKNKNSNVSFNFNKITENEDENNANEQPSSSSLANSDLDNSLNTIKTRFISKIYTKYECLPSKPMKATNFLGPTSLSSNSSPVAPNFLNGKLMKSTASLIVSSSSPTSASISTSTSSISSASISNRLNNETSSSQSISATNNRKGSTKISMFMDNNNNNQNMNKNDICNSGIINSATSALNDLNLAGVTWSVPNIRRQFEAKNLANNQKKTIGLSFNNKIVSEEKKEPFSIPQPILLTHDSSNIYHFFKDINGNPTTYI